MRRATRLAGMLVVTGLATAYILWKIDVRRTLDILGGADPVYVSASLAIMVAATWPAAWRWRRLLRARGIDEPFLWLLRAYFVSWFVGQVLPTSLGGDASRIYEVSRRHSGRAGSLAGSVLLERALGGCATLTLAAVGFALAVGRYELGAYIWIELVLLVAAVALGVALFSRRVRRPLARLVPLLRAVRLDRPVRAVYEGIHAYRDHAGLVAGLFVLTVALQVFRVLAIWLAGKAVGVDLSPRPYYVMGPLLFLVMLVPFTINGLAVRESFFVSFLGQLGVSADAAFATGFLFFVVTIGLALPGIAIVVWETLRGGRSGGLPCPQADPVAQALEPAGAEPLDRLQPGTRRPA